MKESTKIIQKDMKETLEIFSLTIENILKKGLNFSDYKHLSLEERAFYHLAKEVCELQMAVNKEKGIKSKLYITSNYQ